MKLQYPSVYRYYAVPFLFYTYICVCVCVCVLGKRQILSLEINSAGSFGFVDQLTALNLLLVHSDFIETIYKYKYIYINMYINAFMYIVTI